MPAQQDRRRPPERRKASLFVSSTDGVILFARTRDLSLTGFFLETESRPDVGSMLEISLAWGDEVFSCAARVVRTTRDGIAVTLVQPDSYFSHALQEILDSTPPVELQETSR